MQWYYQNSAGQPIGPHSLSEVRKCASEGQIVPETLIRHGESGQWFMASAILDKPHDLDISENEPAPANHLLSSEPPVSFFWTLIDPSFSNSVAVKACSLLYFLVLLFFVGYFFIGILIPLGQELRESNSYQAVDAFLNFILKSVVAFLGLILNRILFEVIVVLFRISETLLDIRYDIDDLKIPRR